MHKHKALEDSENIPPSKKHKVDEGKSTDGSSGEVQGDIVFCTLHLHCFSLLSVLAKLIDTPSSF